jgi:hypothetical protein
MGEVDDELGSMGREEMLAEQHRATRDIGGESSTLEQRRADWHRKQLGLGWLSGVSTDRLRCTMQFDRQQLVKRVPLHVVHRQFLAQFGRAPHGHNCEWITIREVDSLDPKHLGNAERRFDVRWCIDEGELDYMSPSGLSTRFKLGFDCAKPFETLSHGFSCDKPTESLPGSDQPFVAHRIERSADGHPAGPEFLREVSFTRQHRPGR